MNAKTNYIKQRLSLREPLKESLDIVAKLADLLELKKGVDLAAELEKVQALYPSCKEFEREFPSLCFSIATGVGKTRLMGASISYLYLQKGIRNFFVLAPNLTIYDKLIKDFGDPGYQKYVFAGITEFVHNRPVIITGENYNQQGALFSGEEVRINIFNVSKFNAENRGTKEAGVAKPPRIKRLSEYLGQSYWSYLSGLNDLVILMDEAHRYHADASKKAINELQPVLGIELTATPIDEKGNAFNNVVYEYSLAKALADGKYVKNPAVATRKNFQAKGLSPQEIEKIKLEDAISVHQATINALEVYARNNGVRKVKSFILVVCSSISHARKTFDYITSTTFFNGAFNGKVLQIDSSTKKDEEIERQFIDLERYDNDIEIVIHVNMLKEGWDVNNLYTIVPLRAANASVLIEQTIGRGLRLPYNGERTGDDAVDKLTVLAHDNFDKVIEAAQDPNSILQKVSFIELDDTDLTAITEVIQSPSKIQVEVTREEKLIAAMTDEKEKQVATNRLDAKKAIIHLLPTMNGDQGVTKVADLNKPEVKQYVMEQIEVEQSKGQLGMFTQQLLQEAAAIYEEVVTNFKNNIIEIPKIDLVLEDVKIWFEEFDLDVSRGFAHKPLSEEIRVVELTGDRKTTDIGVKYGAWSKDTPVNQVISELINYPEIDYDDNAELLHKLTNQAIDAIAANLSDASKLMLVVRQYRKFIAGNIYDQLKAHLKISEPAYQDPKVLPFVKIEDWNFSALKDGRRHYKDSITPTSLIPKLVFTGFEKACHFEYKFDSKTEKEFAYILENDTTVLKWLRPAPNQFRIYWASNSSRYYPDFVVETANAIYLVETKAANELDSTEVQDKKRAAMQYCQYASQYTASTCGKQWSYLLISHDEVRQSSSFGYLVSRFEQK